MIDKLMYTFIPKKVPDLDLCIPARKNDVISSSLVQFGPVKSR